MVVGTRAQRGKGEWCIKRTDIKSVMILAPDNASGTAGKSLDD